MNLLNPHCPNLPLLSLDDVSRAWKFLTEALVSEEGLSPPPGLEHLQDEEWLLLGEMLNREMRLKERHPLQ